MNTGVVYASIFLVVWVVVAIIHIRRDEQREWQDLYDKRKEK